MWVKTHQWVEALASKTENQSSNPWDLNGRSQEGDSQGWFSPLHARNMVHKYPHKINVAVVF